MNIRIITASAGSGKTTRLSQILDQAIGAGEVDPERVLATTFTRQAAAELIERARARLLESGRGDLAHRLLAARIGTVNAVCGAFVSDFAFELGLAPSLRILDEAAAELELNRALQAVVPAAEAAALQRFTTKFDSSLDWRSDARKLVESARANGLDSAALRACAERSRRSLDACLGPCEPDGDAIDAALTAAIDTALATIETALATIDNHTKPQKTTAKYLDRLQNARRDLARGTLRWGDWAHLSTKGPAKACHAHAIPVQLAAARHLAHPRLRAEMHELIDLLFDVAARGIDAYQEHKRERGVIDYIDQETLLLQLLRRPDVRADLEGQLDLVLVDEFQDTSPLQLAIFLQLASLARRSVWVGDPKQAIYGFRGTDPKLMDSAIEALTSETTDPELIHRAVDALGNHLETLSSSYRSRPELVHLTSDLFAPAFAQQGMPEARTRLQPHPPTEPPGLGPIVEHWPLAPQSGRSSAPVDAACLAAGVQRLLERGARIRDRSGTTRDATTGDLAVLCRTNKQCQLVADALDALGIPAVVPRMGLLDTAEAQLIHAGLRLWLDPRDPLAAAEIARLLSYADRANDLVARLLDQPGTAACADEPAVAAVLAARERTPDAGLLDILEAVTTALDARRHCAAWGCSDQRRANLDALRAHAEAYIADALSNRHAPTLAGFLLYLDALADDTGWYASRTDAQALRGDERAVTVSTWHRAKGLEWPIAILFGLETLRDPDCYGVRVTTDRDTFSIDQPLADRWVRFWPNPYTNGQQGGPVKAAYERSPAYREAEDRANREALRVLYVGWTRARDRLILAARAGHLTAGLLGKLQLDAAPLIVEPTADQPGTTTVTWAGRRLDLWVQPTTQRPALDPAPIPGTLIEGRPAPAPYPPARISPSSAAPVPHRITQVIDLGPALRLRDTSIDLEHLGDAVHAFFAADRPAQPTTDRLALAERLLAGYRVATALDPTDLLTMSDRLWTWLSRTYPDHQPHRELPLTSQTPTGTRITGTADLVLLGAHDLVLADHKSFPGDPDHAAARAAEYSGQLAAYADVLTQAAQRPLSSAWIHFPLAGRIVQVQLEN